MSVQSQAAAPRRIRLRPRAGYAAGIVLGVVVWRVIGIRTSP